MILHNNAKTNKQQRLLIQTSDESDKDLSNRFEVSIKTIRKWRKRNSIEDRSSRPKNIRYKLTEGEQNLLVIIRKITWLPAYEIAELLKEIVPEAKETNVYRTFRRYKVNKRPKKEKEKRKRFKKYEPGFIHIDITYVPKLEKRRRYLYVAIDRATRLVHIKLMKEKKKEYSGRFLKECIKYYPYRIQKILTDNGGEFTNDFYKLKEVKEHPIKRICREKDIEHRKTKIKSPWTNGLVERFNGMIKEETVRKYRYNNYSEMEDALKNYEKVYNLYRKHGSLSRKTPYQVTCEWYNRKPTLFNFRPHKLLKYYGEQRGET